MCPLWHQYINFLYGVVTFNLGTSYMNGASVLDLIARNLPYTIELTVVATIMGVGAGVPLGVLAATNRDKLPDNGVRAVLAVRLCRSRISISGHCS